MKITTITYSVFFIIVTMALISCGGGTGNDNSPDGDLDFSSLVGQTLEIDQDSDLGSIITGCSSFSGSSTPLDQVGSKVNHVADDALDYADAGDVVDSSCDTDVTAITVTFSGDTSGTLSVTLDDEEVYTGTWQFEEPNTINTILEDENGEVYTQDWEISISGSMISLDEASGSSGDTVAIVDEEV